MGGELLNPAAVEVTTTSAVTGYTGQQIIWHLLPYNLLASGTALVVFWLMALHHERKILASSNATSCEDGETTAAPGSIAAAMAKNAGGETIQHINLFKAFVPLIPIILLIFVKRWIAPPGSLLAAQNRQQDYRADDDRCRDADRRGLRCAHYAKTHQQRRCDFF